MTSSSGVTSSISTELTAWKCRYCRLPNLKYNILCRACFIQADDELCQAIIAHAIKILLKWNQTHIAQCLQTLGDIQQVNDLIQQIFSIDFDRMHKLWTIARKGHSDKMKSNSNANEIKIDSQEMESDVKTNKFSPFPSSKIFDIRNYSLSEIKELQDLGYRSIYNNECSVVLMCGGQGTRLGSKDPKGCYDIGLPSHKSIFQLQIEKILSVMQLTNDHFSKIAQLSDMEQNSKPFDPTAMPEMKPFSEEDNITFCRCPLYLMTSESTHNKTRNFLVKHNFFTFDYLDVKLFKQQLFPCFDLSVFDQSFCLLMKSQSEIAMAPNGNGGFYGSLLSTGMLQNMKERGIKYVQVFGIDNILAKLADPLWFGHMIATHAHASNKCGVKRSPTEKVGVMCLKNKRPHVVEYSEITEEMANLRMVVDDESTDLVYGCANLCMHSFTVDFLHKICCGKSESEKTADGGNERYLDLLPIHIARKKIVFYDRERFCTLEPQMVNGIKLEFFIFDSYSFCSYDEITVLKIERSEEFSAVKNRVGKDSVLSARNDFSNLWKARIIANGGKFVKMDGQSQNVQKSDLRNVCEVSALLSYAGENLKEVVEGQTFYLPLYLKTSNDRSFPKPYQVSL